MPIIGQLFGLVSLVCFVLVLVKMFTNDKEKVVFNVIVLIVTCGLWSLVWGWMYTEKIDYQQIQGKQLMIIWTVAAIVGSAINYTIAFG